MHGIRIALFIVLTGACGSVKNTPGVDASPDTPPDSVSPLTAPTVAVTQHPVAGGAVLCTIATPSTGGQGAITYQASWTINGAAFNAATTKTFPNDQVPNATTHTAQQLACTVTASAGGMTATSTAASVTVEGRFAYLIDQAANPQTLDKIDLDTLAISVVGPIGIAFSFGDIAWNSKQQQLYMTDGQTAGALYKINVATGAATLVGAHNVAGMRALGYDPVGDKMYGGLGSGTPSLYSMNLATGAATMIGGTTTYDGLAFDTKRARMVGITANVGGGAFSTITTATGATAALGSAGPIDNDGLTYDPYVDAYWAATFPGEILRYDGATLARTNPTTLAGKRFTSLAIVLPP